MTRRLPLVVGLFFAASATAPAGADTPTIPPDYLCKPQQTATLSAGAQTATTPLDYLCKPQPATAPGGADTPTTSRDYRCKPQPTAAGGAETTTAPLDYLCKPQLTTVSAPAEEQNAENARPADVTPRPENDTAKAAVPVGAPLQTVEDLPQYKFARSVQESSVAGGSAESRYLTTVYGMIKSHLHESPDLRLDLANRHGSWISTLTRAALWSAEGWSARVDRRTSTWRPSRRSLRLRPTPRRRTATAPSTITSAKVPN